MTVLVAIVTLTVLGIPVALLVDRNARGGALAGVGFLYGTGLVYVCELLLSLVQVRWTAVNVTAAAVALSAACMFLRRPSEPRSAFPRRRFGWATAVDALTAVTVLGYALFATVAAPWEWDFWAIWGLKGRVFFENGGIDWHFLGSQWNAFAHPDYPSLLPLNYAYVALLGGGWDDRWLGLLFVAFAAALLLIVRQLAADELAPLSAANVTFAASGFVLSYAVGLAELPLIAFGTAGILLVRRSILADYPAAMGHGVLLLALAASCKNEGITLLLFAELALLFTSPKRFAALSPAIVLPAIWLVLAALHGLRGDLVTPLFVTRFVDRIQHPQVVFRLLVTRLEDPWVWGWMLAALIVVPAALRKRERFVALVVAFQLAAFVVVYFGTPNDLWWHIVTSWGRLTKQIAAPLLFVVMVMLAQVIAGYDHRDHAKAGREP